MKWLAALSAFVIFQTSPLTQSETADVVRGVGTALREGNLYPDIGRRLSDVLDRKIEAGEFEGIRSPVELGGTITAVLQQETNDLHLIVCAAGGAPTALRSMAGTPMVARAERLAGSIGPPTAPPPIVQAVVGAARGRTSRSPA